jgi:hypothetical protein
LAMDKLFKKPVSTASEAIYHKRGTDDMQVQ